LFSYLLSTSGPERGKKKGVRKGREMGSWSFILY
jgi:hypothetical protein